MPKARILIVEDERIVAADLEERLVRLGYDVIGVEASGEAAITRARETKPDLVLTDIMLEGESRGEMDGVEVAHQLRQQFQIPVVYLTALSGERLLERAKVTEPYGYIMKPFEERELYVNIEVALYRHRMDQERDRLTRELQEALAEVKILRGLLPICSYCKKIGNDAGHWQSIEAYLKAHAEVQFTHSVCPECFAAQIKSITPP